MPELIEDPRYWARRLRDAPAGARHHSIFRCPLDRWLRIEERHREILAGVLAPRSSILDCGCGYGRLLDLLPDSWDGRYLGVDLSPDFLRLAQEEHPRREFIIADLRTLDIPDRFDWAILISVRPMVKRNMGDEAWALMEQSIRRHVGRLLFLEYDEHDGGSVE